MGGRTSRDAKFERTPHRKAWRCKYRQSEQYRAKARLRNHAPKRQKYLSAYARVYNRRPEVVAYNREWKRKNGSAIRNRRRARELAGGKYTPTEWRDLLRRYGHRCLCCGLGELQIKSLRRKLVPDHVIPLANGGSNDISNLQPLCHGRGGCNNRKGTKPIDYRPRAGRRTR